ncbi:MAG: FAD-dependent monooxygenase [Pseudomonadota bacterium]
MPKRSDDIIDTDVLVVGGGPAGLALALELGTQGRRCMLVECNPRSGLVPRAKTTNVRTRELLRRWGIADKLAAASPFGTDYPSNVVFATRMGGRELARFENAFSCAPARDPRFSEHAQWIPQYKVEAVLKARVQELDSVALRFATRLLDFTQDGDTVLATLEDVETRTTVRVRARFLVGADGARSTVREKLGIRMEGTSPLGQHTNVVFRAPGLAGAHALGPAVMYWLLNPDVPCVIAPLDQGDLWTFGYSRANSGDATPEQLIPRALGFDIGLEVLSTDEWTAHQLLAQRYREGRVFLAGDACHLHPPFGGHGMNMGIADAVDLGWKLSAVLSGWGGPALLDSYEIERRQVHQRVVNESVVNHSHSTSNLLQPHLDEDGEQGDAIRAEVRERILALKRAEFYSLGVVIGAHYEASPILAREPADQPTLEPTYTYQPNARPGCRAPHHWLQPGRQWGASLYDHFTPAGFTLLVTRAAAEPHAAAVQAEAATLRVPLLVTVPNDDALRELYGTDLVLVRPDHHVAWRGNDAQAACAALAFACGAPVSIDFPDADLPLTTTGDIA